LSMVIDPVCGMEVQSDARTLSSTVRPGELSLLQPEGRRRGALEPEDPGLERFWFCGRGCLLDFGDDPARFLDAGYEPSGM